MRLKESVKIEELLKFGFEFPNTEDEDYCIKNADCIYNIGHSRRGQFYYLIVKDKEFSLFASEPDGDGGAIKMPRVIIDLYESGLIEN